MGCGALLHQVVGRRNKYAEQEGYRLLFEFKFLLQNLSKSFQCISSKSMFCNVYIGNRSSFSQNASIFVVILIRYQGNFECVSFEYLSQAYRLYSIKEFN